jgi:hypothetical protein
MLLIIAFNKIRGICVGADVSAFCKFSRYPSYFVNPHYRPSVGFHDIPLILLNFMIITQRLPRTSESKRAPSFYPRVSYAGTS